LPDLRRRSRMFPLCSIGAHDADECRDETLVQLHGGHVVRVPCPLDEVLGWFT
jgi:hypothetical protein